ncbi:uncharacterized protein KGF55_004058 [Candida pseudojiufengensis]|uniref:uncharacterized protein n=1 Tax=Candida pseudojiufengensis TaxID=497109 RepID=UPI0022251F45|nr:uncharacterized protein KGF55_004058 [Candida pseudojiufengensis]KAI5961435.1 hypothetical protein KGF55_004058 [Candida pseudojiufengensis]
MSSSPRPSLKNIRRVASPSPSARPISNRRVHESDRLLNRIDSLKYSTTSDDDSCSINYSQYTPTSSNFDQLEWGDILPYYLPCLSWINKYNLKYFIGDLIGGLTLVFFQLPLSLSYATTLAHVPVISGLYSLGLAPLIYMIFGSVPQMVVGPEAPISLVVGQAVEPLLHHAKKKDLDPLEFVAVVTFISGASLLGFGLGRLGFLDNVLSPSLLKGFIAGVGIVMIINSLIIILGLEALLKQISDDPNQMDIHSPFDKVVFLIMNFGEFDSLSLKIGLVGFIVIMTSKILKKKYSRLILLPEIMIVVVVATILCQIYRWDLKGLAVIGKVKNSNVLTLYNPFAWKLIKKLGTSGFLCAMLGFFESTTASKSLGSSFDLPISSNRELVALGSLNIFGSFFGALPAFGGYGRSKINAISAKTTMSGAIMGLVTIFTIQVLLDYLYFVPECILSVVIAVIGISLIEEAPYELLFYWRTGGKDEMITFAITVFTTLFFSIEGGIAVGLVYSLIRVIKNSAESRIQILGRIPNSNTFVDADIPMAPQGGSQLNIFNDMRQTQLNHDAIEEVEGCLIIKIPEPLSFTNCSDLLVRLKRVEMYGSTRAHPASKRSRDLTMTQYVIFDLDSMNSIDSSAAKTMKELITNYQKRDIKSCFVKVAKSVRPILRDSGIRDLLRNDLKKLKYYEIQDLADNSENDGIKRCHNLIVDDPYFDHISDTLKLIDCFENMIV